MKYVSPGFAFALTASVISVANGINPLAKVLETLSNLEKKLLEDESVSAEAFNKYREYCSISASQKAYEIKTGTQDQAKLDATIADRTSNMEHCTEEIESWSGQIAEYEKKLKDATEIRKKERDEFEAAEKELMEAIGMLNKAISVLEKEMTKQVSFVQSKANTEILTDILVGLSSVIDAAGFDGETNTQQLTAFVQRRQDAEDAGEQPQKKAYEGQSQGIVDAMDNMRNKAEEQLRAERTGEKNQKHNFDMTKIALKSSIEDAKKQMAGEKGELAQNTQEKATAEGQLSVTKKDLTAARKAQEEVRHDCIQRAADHDVTVAGLKEEMAVIGKAKVMILASQEAVGMIQTTDDNSADTDDSAESFLQVKAKAKVTSLSKSMAAAEVIKSVSMLSTSFKDAGLEALASKMTAAFKFAEDPFTKVKAMIKEMVDKLQKEAREEASEKAYCDKEMGVTKIKKSDLEDQTEGLKAHIDVTAAGSAKLKEEVKELQLTLADLAGAQVKLNSIREEENAAYKRATWDLQTGLNDIQGAIKMLKEYYASDDGAAAASAAAASFLQVDDEEEESDDDDSDDGSSATSTGGSWLQQPTPPIKHEKSGGAGAGLIGLLEVVESDLAKNIAEEQTEEQTAVQQFEEEVQTATVTKSSKGEEIKLKTKQYKAMDKVISDQESDLDSAGEELDAVNAYWQKLDDRCIAKPEKYEDVKARREKEIKGLEASLEILKSQNSFLQKRRRR